MAWSGWRRPFIAALASLLSIQAGSTAPASASPAEPYTVVDQSEAEPAPKRFASPSVGAPESQPLGDKTELEDRRTESSRTFDNGNGTYTTELFTDPIHYRPDGDGDWQAIDIGFEPIDGARPESDLVAASTKAPVQVSIGANKRSDGFLVLEAGGRTHAISLTAADASRASVKTPAIEDARADWSDFLPGVDLRVIAGAEGAKTFLILDQPPATSEWTFLIDAPGLTAELAADGSVGLFDGKDQVAWIPAPYAVDSSNSTERGSGEMTDQVSLSVGQREGRIALTVRVEPDWLAKATYPVFVDPSFSYDFFPNTTTYGDAFVSTKYPTMNFADYVRPDSPFYHEHWLGMDPTDSSNVNKVLMRFDLDELDDATVDLARLWIYPYHQYYNAPTATTTWINRITGSWAENTVTENNQPGSSSPSTSGSFIEGDYDYFTLTGLVQDWAEGTYPNYGVKLHENGNNGTYWKRLISYEQGGTQAQYRPMLEVDWHFPVGTPSNPTGSEWTKSRTLSWNYSDSEGASQSHFQVQVDNNSNFSSPLSSSGTVASSTHSWAIPGGVSLTTGTTYYWRVKVKNGSGWSAWSSGAAFRWDQEAPELASSAVAGALNVVGNTHYELGNGSVTIKLKGEDLQSGVRISYLRLQGADEMRVKHDWNIGGTHCDVFMTSTMVDTTACSETVNSGGQREVTYTVVGLNQSATFDIQWYFADIVGNASSEYSSTNQTLIFDAAAPTGSISDPAEDAVVSGIVDVVGTASDTNFHQYTLEYGAGESPLSWSPIGTPSTSPVTNGTLGSWDTTSLDNGEYTIRLNVYDKARISSGYTTVLRHVTVDNGGGTADITDPQESDHVRGTISIVGTAAADSGFSGYALEYGSGCAASSWDDIGSNPRSSPVIEGTLGTWDTSTVADGDYTIRLTTERSGLPPVSDTVCVRIDNTGPTAAITAPEADEEVSNPVSIVGTANDANFASYTLEFGEGSAPTTWEPIGTNPRTVPVIGDDLGSWDISALDSGTYTIRLRVYDIAGGSGDFAEVTRQVTVPVNPNAQIDIDVTNVAVDLLPHLDLDVTTNDAVVPGAQVTYDVEVGHGGGTIQVGATLTAENSGDVPLVVESLTAVIETRAVGSGTWQPLAAYDLTASGWTAVNPAPSAPHTLDVEADPIDAAGVEYPFDFPAILGTQVEPGSTASWNLGAYLGLEPEALEDLLDDGATAEIRQVLYLEVSPRDSQLGQPFSVTTDLTEDIQGTDPTLSDIAITVQPPTGSPTVFDETSIPALGSMDLDDPGVVDDVPYAVPGTTERGSQESVDDYLQRLKDFGIQRAEALAEAVTGSGPVATEAMHESVGGVPILLAESAGEGGATGGTSLLRSLKLTNVGGAIASDIDVTASVGGTVSGFVTNLASLVGSGQADDGEVQFAIPSSYAEGLAEATFELTWTDFAQHQYGPIDISADVWITNGASGAPTVDVAAIDRPLFGIEPIEVTASDDVGVTLVELLIDEVVVGSDPTQPYVLVVDTAALLDGQHDLQVRASDGTTNVSTTVPVSIAVDNQLRHVDRIATDLESGRLSVDDAAINTVLAVTGSPTLPSRYAGPASEPSGLDGMPSLSLLLSNWDDLQQTTQDAVIDGYAAYLDEAAGGDLLVEFEDFDQYCSTAAECELQTPNFTIAYSLNDDPEVESGDDGVPPVDVEKALGDFSGFDEGCSPCSNEIPDSIDRLAVSFETALDFYTSDLEFSPPSSPSPVLVHWNNDENSFAPPWPFAKIEIHTRHALSFPFYIARHELFHFVQYQDMSWPGYFGTTEGWWWLEASAEWAAHAAQQALPALQDATTDAYAEGLDEFLARPNAALSDHTDGRGYGAFIFAEFLEEQFAQFGEFSGSGDLIPDPGIIREIWDEIDVVAPSWTIAQVIQEEDAGLEDVLGAFHRAMYLLDSTVGTHRFAGTIRDQDLSDWRPILGGDGPTGGDTGFPEVSAVPRAARERVELPGRTATRWSDPVAVSVDAGGAAYVEMLIPSDGANTYEVQVRAPGTNVFLRATAIPFGAGDPPPGSAYPTPCAYDTAFSTVLEGDDTVAHAKLVIPDNCGAITVIVSNAHTIAEPFTAEVLARTSSVADQFERLRPGGWGVADKGWIWRDPGGGPVDGFVVERAAHLSGAGSSAQLSLTGVNIDTLLLVGRFADCEDPAQILGVGLPDQAPVFLRSDGLLFAHPDIAVVDSFVPCEPWYLRLDHGGARVWQATKPEPIDWPVTVPGDDPRFHYLRLFADHAAGGDNEVMIDVLDLTWVSG